MTYIKESIITKLQKLCSPPRNLRVGNKSPVLVFKKCFCTGDLSPACKIFIERPEEGCFNKANSFRNSNAGSYNRNFNIKSRKTNPVNKDCEITRCNVCGSIYHWTKSCPNSYEYLQNPKHDQEV